MKQWIKRQLACRRSLWLAPFRALLLVLTFVAALSAHSHRVMATGRNPTTVGAPALTIPATAIRVVNGSFRLPINFAGNGVAITAVSFALDYDENCLTFDDHDSNGDGIPEAITDLPASFATSIIHDRTKSTRELGFTIFDVTAPLATLPDGRLLTVAFTVKPTCITTDSSSTTVTVNFATSPAVSFSDLLAQDVSGSATGATIVLYFNYPPTAQDDSVTVNEDSANNSINVLSNDSTAPDSGESLVIIRVGLPNAGGAVNTNGSALTYRPALNFNGSERFTYTVSDGNGGQATATVTVTVLPVNDAPQTRILSKPLNPSMANVSFTFDGSDLDGTVAGFQCKLDSAAFASCRSPQSYSGLSVGSHTVQVRAVDNAGAVDLTPARYTWNVAAGTASVTIELAMTPAIASNIRFTGSLGTFFLDDGAVDDGDGYSKSKVFTVAAGSYTVNQRLSAVWHLLAIDCTPTAAVVTDLANKRVTITVVNGAAVTCRFVAQRAVNLYARAYHDLVRNGTNRGKRNVADPYLAGIGMTLYLPPTNRVAGSATTLGVSATITEARFLNLPAGAYVVCETLPNGWIQTDPNPASPLPGYAGQPCKSITLPPGKGGVLFFGQYPSTVTSSAVADENEPYEADAIFDLPLEEWVNDAQPEEDAIIEEGNEDDETATASQRSFLPLVLK
jgi:hypothetical protein